VANVRETDGSDDYIFLNGGGGSLAGWGMMWVGRLMDLAGTDAIMSAVDTPSTTLGVLYHPAATITLKMGSTTTDSFSDAYTLNTTDVFLIGFTKAAGTTAPRFHARNLTTGAAAVHDDADSGAVADQAGTWDQTEIGSADGGTFFGNKRHAVAAVFTSVYTDGEFDGVSSAKTTASIHALTPARLWDFDQASTATAVVNLMTGSNDQTGIVGTTVVNDAAFDLWTFGVVTVDTSGSGGALVRPGRHRGRYPARDTDWY
jgi:hypothetical protein